MREYIEFFPKEGLAVSLRAFLDSEISPFPAPVKEDGEEDPVVEEKSDESDESAPDQRLDDMIDGVERSPKSVLCHRILGEYYLLLDEYENAVDISRIGRKLVAEESLRTGLSCQKTLDALTVTLGTALIHYQAPKHHSEARSLFETVLKHNTGYGSALVGLGLILEEQGDYAGAADLFWTPLKTVRISSSPGARNLPSEFQRQLPILHRIWAFKSLDLGSIPVIFSRQFSSPCWPIA